MANDPPPKTFEESIAELETVVKRLESGDLPLEEALAAFENGIGLVRALHERVDQAEAKVEVLTRSASGDLQTQAMDVDADPSDHD